MSLNARDFTQGGQVMKYMIGMFLQIMNIASYWVLLFSALVFTGWMLLSLTLQEFAHGSAYWLIKGFVMPFRHLTGRVPSGSWTFHFTRDSGEEVTFTHTAAQVMNDAYFVAAGDRVKEAAFYGWGIAAACFILAMTAITWYLGSKGARQRKDEITGGRVLVEGPKPLNKLLKQADRLSPLHICGLHLLKDAEMQNFGLHGTVGSGKSTALNSLLKQLRARGDRVIIYDKGNNFIPLFYRQKKDSILNPFDARCAPWDLWEECRSVTDFENFATSLLPDSSGSSDPFWVLSARALFVATARRMAKERDRNIGALLKMLMRITLADLREYLQGTDAANLVDGSIEKTAMTIRTILTTYVRSLRYLQGLDQQGRHPFNLRDWLATEEADGDNPWIFISSDGRNHNAIRPLISAWLYMTMTGILGLTAHRQRRIWVVVDEVPTLHKLPILPEFSAEGRKFGGCLLLGLQNFPQLEEQFGTNFARAIWDLLNTRLFYRAPSGTVAKWVQEEIGEKRHKKFRDQYSYGVDIIRDGVQFSKDEVNEYLVSYSDVQSLNDLECYVTLPGDWPVVRMTLTREPMPEIAEGRVERDVEALLDPDLEAQLIAAATEDLTGGLVGRLFGEDAISQSSATPGGVPAATTTEAEDKEGRSAATAHAGPLQVPAAVRESETVPVTQPESAEQMQAPADVRHRGPGEDFGVKF